MNFAGVLDVLRVMRQYNCFQGYMFSGVSKVSCRVEAPMFTRSLCHALPTADEDADEDVWQGAQLSSIVGACDGTTEAGLSNIQHDRAIPKLA